MFGVGPVLEMYLFAKSGLVNSFTLRRFGVFVINVLREFKLLYKIYLEK